MKKKSLNVELTMARDLTPTLKLVLVLFFVLRAYKLSIMAVEDRRKALVLMVCVFSNEYKK